MKDHVESKLQAGNIDVTRVDWGFTAVCKMLALDSEINNTGKTQLESQGLAHPWLISQQLGHFSYRKRQVKYSIPTTLREV